MNMKKHANGMAALVGIMGMVASLTSADASPPVVSDSILDHFGFMTVYEKCSVKMYRTGDFATPPTPEGDLAVLSLGKELKPDPRPMSAANNGPASNPWGMAPIQDISNGNRPRLSHMGIEDGTEFLVMHMVVLTDQEPRGIALKAWGVPGSTDHTRIAGIVMPGYVSKDASPPTYTMRRMCRANPKYGTKNTVMDVATIWSEKPVSADLPQKLNACRMNPSDCNPGKLQGKVLYRIPMQYDRHIAPEVEGRPKDTALWLDLDEVGVRVDRINARISKLERIDRGAAHAKTDT